LGTAAIMSTIPLYVIDYPEAQIALRHLEKVRGARAVEIFESVGHKPNTATIEPRPLPPDPFIVMNGSGNFHHESYALFEGFVSAHPAQQFLYLQIDAHPDKDDTYRWKLDCASFVGKIMEHKAIDQVYLLGLYPVCLDTDNDNRIYIKRVSYFRCDYFKKLSQYIVEPTEVVETMFMYPPEALEDAKNNSSVESVKEVEIEVPNVSHLPDSIRPEAEKALEVKWKTLEAFDPSVLPDLPIYLTIDLDVARDGVVTDWRREPNPEDITTWGYGDNQGNMAFKDMIELIRQIGQARAIWGADFCGLTEEFDAMSQEAQDHSLAATEEVYDVLQEVMPQQIG
jgi:hypothetical protein